MDPYQKDVKGIEVAATVDAVGFFCPIPLVKLNAEIKKVEAGDIVKLLADDPGIQDDLPLWCREKHHELISIEKNSEGIFVAYVRKL